MGTQLEECAEYRDCLLSDPASTIFAIKIQCGIIAFKEGERFVANSNSKQLKKGDVQDERKQVKADGVGIDDDSPLRLLTDVTVQDMIEFVKNERNE